MREINRIFGFYEENRNEAAELYAREQLKMVREGRGYWGEIKVKVSLVGMNEKYDVVKRFTNLDNTLWVIYGCYETKVTSIKPEYTEI